MYLRFLGDAGEYPVQCASLANRRLTSVSNCCKLIFGDEISSLWVSPGGYK